MRQQYRWGWYQLVMPHRTTRTPCNMCSVRTHALSDKRSVSHAHTHVSLLHGREKGEGRARRGGEGAGEARMGREEGTDR